MTEKPRLRSISKLIIELLEEAWVQNKALIKQRDALYNALEYDDLDGAACTVLSQIREEKKKEHPIKSGDVVCNCESCRWKRDE